jgi:D-beta-D-heptose 7-phosphate kinase/D-beta-D-heptose 1-phosphate adenosyltransferase
MKIAVIGESCLDVFITGTCNRICPEGPVPVLDVFRSDPDAWHNQTGMACNVAQNVKGMGAEVEGFYRDAGTKTRYLDEASGQLLLRVDEPQIPEPIRQEELQDFVSKANECDAVIVSDYNKGFLSSSDILRLSQWLKVPSFLDTKSTGVRYPDVHGFTAVKINKNEAAANPAIVNNNTVVTMGCKGCEYEGVRYQPGDTVEVRSVSGAGDTFIAALAVRYVSTKDMVAAIHYALKCAGEVVKHPGTTVYEEICQKELQLLRGPADS